MPWVILACAVVFVFCIVYLTVTQPMPPKPCPAVAVELTDKPAGGGGQKWTYRGKAK